VEKLKTIKLRGVRQDNKPYFKVYLDLEKIILGEARDVPERIPSKLKPLIAMPDFPEKLVRIVEKAAA